MKIKEQLLLAAHKEQEFAAEMAYAMASMEYYGYPGDADSFRRMMKTHLESADYLMSQALSIVEEEV